MEPAACAPLAHPTALFVSHGSPMTALQGGAAGAFMQSYGQQWRTQFPKPRAILALSAHTLASEATVLAAREHAAVYDFGGFDPRLRTLRYDAPGSPELARQVAERLQAARWPVRVSAQGGLDHGLWTPLRYLWPDADVPVLPLAWNPDWTPEQLMELGAVLAPLSQEGVWLLTSGSITHNLGWFMREPQPMQAPERAESAAFRQWWHAHSVASDWPALCAYRTLAPHGVDMHPTDEHLLPFFVAAGWGAALARRASRVHESAQHGVIGMDAYAF